MWRAARYPRPSHEADLPAQEAQARTHPRLPRAHGHARRPADAEAPPVEGPAPPHGLSGGPLVSKRGRLSRSADFERVYRQGRSHANRWLVLYAFPRAPEGEPRLGLSVSRKVGGAVERNRVKRLLREAFALESHRLPPGTDAVVVARTDAKGLAEREGLAGIQRVLGDLVATASGSGDTGSAGQLRLREVPK